MAVTQFKDWSSYCNFALQEFELVYDLNYCCWIVYNSAQWFELAGIWTSVWFEIAGILHAKLTTGGRGLEQANTAGGRRGWSAATWTSARLRQGLDLSRPLSPLEQTNTASSSSTAWSCTTSGDWCTLRPAEELGALTDWLSRMRPLRASSTSGMGTWRGGQSGNGSGGTIPA